MGFFGDRRLKRKGEDATGVVTAAMPLHSDHESAIVPYRLRLQVSGDRHGEREVELKATARRDLPLGDGTKLAVKSDPDDPQRVAIDWEASNEILRAEGIPGLEGTELGRAIGKVVADGHKASDEDIEELKRQSGGD